MSYTIDTTRFPNRVHEDAVAGTYNGSNQTFTLKYVPLSQSLAIYNASGQYLREGTDFTRSQAVLTATTAPESGDNWVADYYTQG